MKTQKLVLSLALLCLSVMIFAKDFNVISVVQTINWHYYVPWILCGVVFLSSVYMVLLRTKTKSEVIPIYYIFIVSFFVPFLGMLCGFAIKLILMLSYGTVGEAFPMAFMISFAIWFFIAGCLDFGLLSGILAAIAGAISGYFFSINLMSEQWDFFLMSIACVFLGFPIGMLIKHYRLRKMFNKIIKQNKQKQVVAMETNKKTNAELLRQYTVDAKKHYFQQVSLYIIVLLGSVLAILNYLYELQVHYHWIIYIVVGLLAVVYIVSVFITVSDEKNLRTLTRTKLYIEKKIRNKDNEYIKEERRLKNPKVSKSQIHKNLLAIKDARVLYKEVLDEISVLLARSLFMSKSPFLLSGADFL
jgi:MFS family permease